MSYQKPIYIISVSKPLETQISKFYLTNRTNAKATWDVVKERFGIESDTEHCLIMRYAEEGDEDFTEIPARKAKIKPLCLESVRNSIIIFPENDPDNKMKITMDYIGGGI